MTTTGDLRRLLDERGVEHFDGTECTLWGYEQTSDSTGCYRCAADEVGEGFMTLRMHHITPEQAIEATLGRGKCTLEKVCDGYLYFRVHECNECGTRFAYRAIRSDKNARPNYCPNCGAKVVDE